LDLFYLNLRGNEITWLQAPRVQPLPDTVAARVWLKQYYDIICQEAQRTWEKSINTARDKMRLLIRYGFNAEQCIAINAGMGKEAAKNFKKMNYKKR